MGISTVGSYTAAQVFEAIGLSREVVDEYFTGTVSRLGGVGLDVLAREVELRHRAAYPENPSSQVHRRLDVGGIYQYRRDGELHLFTPETVSSCCSTRPGRAERTSSRSTARRSIACPRRAGRCGTVRVPARAAPTRAYREVEPAESIFARFNTGAMSYGSISAEAHETMAIAMNRLGGRSNSGEGGEDVDRLYDPMAAQRRQTGRERAIRCHQRLPRQRHRHPDQDGTGRQPGARPTPGVQGLSVDRANPHRRRVGTDLAAAAPRHLLHRGPRPAHPRPQERERERPRPRQGSSVRSVSGRSRPGSASPCRRVLISGHTAAPAHRRSPPSSTPDSRGRWASPTRSRPGAPRTRDRITCSATVAGAPHATSWWRCCSGEEESGSPRATDRGWLHHDARVPLDTCPVVSRRRSGTA